MASSVYTVWAFGKYHEDTHFVGLYSSLASVKCHLGAMSGKWERTERNGKTYYSAECQPNPDDGEWFLRGLTYSATRAVVR